jgi:hypothetical protein
MKILSEPSSGTIGNRVAFINWYGQCQRELVTPKNTSSPARDHMRGSFGRFSRAWSQLLTDASAMPGTLPAPKSRAPSVSENQAR